MRKYSLLLGAVLGGVMSLPLMALFYLGDAFAGLPFVPFVLFDWLARVLPGDVVTIGIDAIVRMIGVLNLGGTSEAAKLIEQLMALALVLFAGMSLGVLITWVRRRTAGISGMRIGAIGGVAMFFLSWAAASRVGFPGDPALSLIWLAILWVGWGALLGSWIDLEALTAIDRADWGAERREVLTKIAGGSLLVTLAAWGTGWLLDSQSRASGASQPLAAERPVSDADAVTDVAPDAELEVTPAAEPEVTTSVEYLGATEEELEDRLEPAPGTRPELTSNEAFYRIDINTRPPVIQEESWTLEVDGLFDNPQRLTLDDLMAFPAVTQPLTMACISNRIGGDLIGTSNWTGVRLRDLLDEWGLKPEARALYVEAADGFYETVVMEDMMDPRTLLVYGMNDETLPVEHGFPLRIYIPNRYGMKQPKWITRIEAIDEWEAGYWVVRGWSREARPHIVSVIDTVAKGEAEDGRIPVGGIAWAGDRGIQRVEVQVDDGEWEEAELRTPPLSSLTWVLWRYDWPATPGRHTLQVRATDGTGALQIEERTSVRPDGATGYHSVTTTI
ncbi:MAG: molybdopterin-dependent oxidoreductase [Chloroflexota bacterium]|nr:molybdopterin-dependent oxidoreductase [Chloroflexota bacterium]